jgi:hypothetical protein
MQTAEKQYRKVVFVSGVYDLIVTFPFAVPGLVGVQLETLTKIQGWLGLTGEFPVFEPFHLFFLNLFGTIVTIWAALRIMRPEPLFGLADGIGRAAFSTLMLYYLLVWGIPRVVVLFLVPEVLFGVAQLLGYYWLLAQTPRVHLDVRVERD